MRETSFWLMLLRVVARLIRDVAAAGAAHLQELTDPGKDVYSIDPAIHKDMAYASSSMVDLVLKAHTSILALRGIRQVRHDVQMSHHKSSKPP